jgi:hypothetical protein
MPSSDTSFTVTSLQRRFCDLLTLGGTHRACVGGRLGASLRKQSLVGALLALLHFSQPFLV